MGLMSFGNKLVTIKSEISSMSKERLVYTDEAKENVHVLAGGPSLKYSINYVKIIGGECIGINGYLADRKDEYPDIIALCMADPAMMGIGKTYSDLIDAQISAINEYDKPLTLFTPFKDKIPRVDNRNVQFRCINGSIWNTEPKNKFELLKKNIFAPEFQTTTIMGIYAAIQLGYKNIYVHGFDMDYIKKARIDEDGQAYIVSDHFNEDYEKYECYVLKANLLEEFEADTKVYRAVHLLKQYAGWLGVNIINMSKESMVDEFARYHYHDDE